MVQLPDKVKAILDQFLQALKQGDIPVREAILFGSYAQGSYGEWSDIDLALVSDLFMGNRMDDKDKIRKITLSISSELEVIPFAPQDFTPQDPFVNEILKFGVKLV